MHEVNFMNENELKSIERYFNKFNEDAASFNEFEANDFIKLFLFILINIPFMLIFVGINIFVKVFVSLLKKFVLVPVILKLLSSILFFLPIINVYL